MTIEWDPVTEYRAEREFETGRVLRISASGEPAVVARLLLTDQRVRSVAVATRSGLRRGELLLLVDGAADPLDLIECLERAIERENG
jgi:hypothetical protein